MMTDDVSQVQTRKYIEKSFWSSEKLISTTAAEIDMKCIYDILTRQKMNRSDLNDPMTFSLK